MQQSQLEIVLIGNTDKIPNLDDADYYANSLLDLVDELQNDDLHTISKKIVDNVETLTSAYSAFFDTQIHDR